MVGIGKLLIPLLFILFVTVVHVPTCALAGPPDPPINPRNKADCDAFNEDYYRYQNSRFSNYLSCLNWYTVQDPSVATPCCTEADGPKPPVRCQDVGEEFCCCKLKRKMLYAQCLTRIKPGANQQQGGYQRPDWATVKERTENLVHGLAGVGLNPLQREVFYFNVGVLNDYTYGALKDFEDTFKQWKNDINSGSNPQPRLHMIESTPLGVLKESNLDYSQGDSGSYSLAPVPSLNYNTNTIMPVNIEPGGVAGTGNTGQCQQLAAQIREYDRCINQMVSKRAVYPDCRKGPAGWNEHVQACLSYKNGKEANQRQMQSMGCK